MTIKIGTETINNDYHTPYGAGYSKDGKTLYIDKRIPRYATLDGTRVDIWKIVAVHELAEEALEHAFELDYPTSHAMAIGAEKVALKRFFPGVSWETYDKWWNPLIKECARTFSSLPPDLDWQPVIDSNDTRIIRMVNTIRPGTIKLNKDTLHARKS